MIDKELTRQLGRLRPPRRGCRSKFHREWHSWTMDEITHEMLPPPTCPRCGGVGEHLIRIEYEEVPIDGDGDRPALRRTRLGW